MSVYTDTVRAEVLTPEALENVHRAAPLLRVVAVILKEALDGGSADFSRANRGPASVR